jgi:hypothetical protein
MTLPVKGYDPFNWEMTGLNSVYRKSWTGGLSRRPEAVIESLKSLGSIESDPIDS